MFQSKNMLKKPFFETVNKSVSGKENNINFTDAFNL